MKKDKYLSREYTNCLRGIFAIVVVCHHLYQYIELFNGTRIGSMLEVSGSLAVSVFFFYSGYGLMLSSQKKDYIKNFFRNRFLPLYCFYVVLIIIYIGWTLLLEKSIMPQEILQSFFFGETIVSKGWYLQATFVLYLLYLFSFAIFKSSKMQITVFAITIVFYCAFCHFMGLNIWWYQSILSVILGMLWCCCKDKIDAILNKYSIVVFVLSLILFAAAYIICNMWTFVILKMIRGLLFVCVTVVFSYILCNTFIINNLFFNLCGKYSLEIYVSHGLFLRLIKLNIVNNKIVYVLVVIVGTVVTSLVLKIIYNKIVSLISKKKQPVLN